MVRFDGKLTFSRGKPDDAQLLAELNQQLIRDEGHRNRMSLAELEGRMRRWLEGEYNAILFRARAELVAYAVFCERKSEVYLRQFFVVPHRRRAGIGRAALAILRLEIWPSDKRLTVEVLAQNHAAIAFWRACGYRDYSLTLEIAPPADA